MNDTIKYSYSEIMEIEENWENFPWKLDYILYILFSQENAPTDIILTLNKNENVAINFKNKNSHFDSISIDLEDLQLKKPIYLNI